MNCPLNMECKELSVQCLDCKLNENCTYGQEVTAECQIKSQVKCKVCKPLLEILNKQVSHEF